MELGDLLGQLGGTLEIHETERERRRQKSRFLGLGQSDEDEEGEEGGGVPGCLHNDSDGMQGRLERTRERVDEKK